MRALPKAGLMVVFMVVCIAMVATDAVHASSRSEPCRAMKKGETVRLDFKATPLGRVARAVSCLLDVNLLFQPSGLKNTSVSLIGPRPLRRSDVWRLFVSVLDQHRLEVNRRGAFYTISPSKGP